MSSSPHSFRASVDILEELQLIAAQNLEKLDIDKYYEVVCELGKGTYGKVDLVVHKIRGEPQLLLKFYGQQSIAKTFSSLSFFGILRCSGHTWTSLPCGLILHIKFQPLLKCW